MADSDIGSFGIKVLDVGDDEGPITVNVTQTTQLEPDGSTVTNKSITLPINRRGLSHAQLIEILKVLEKFWQEE